MTCLRFLGGAAIHGAHGAPGGRAGQARRVALLALLATARTRAVVSIRAVFTALLELTTTRQSLGHGCLMTAT